MAKLSERRAGGVLPAPGKLDRTVHLIAEGLPQVDRRIPLRIVVWTFGVILVVAAVWFYWRSQGIKRGGVDEYVYTYVGWAWLHGDWPYLHSFDNKGPLVMIVAMLRVALLGIQPEMLGVQQIIVGLFTAALIAGIAHYVWGGLSSALAFVLGVLFWTQGGVQGGLVATPSSLIGMFTTASILAAIMAVRRPGFGEAARLALAMGICWGLALCVKPNALSAPFVSLAVVWFLGRYRTRREQLYLTLLGGLGALAPILAVALVFYTGGALNALYEAYIAFNSVRSGQMLEGGGILNLLQRTRWILSLVGLWRKELALLIVPFVALAAVPVLFGRAKIPSIFHKFELILALWLVLEFGLVATNGGWGYQAFPVLPPTVLAVTWLVVAASRIPSTLSRTSALVMGLVLVAVPAVSTALTRPEVERVERLDSHWNQVVDDMRNATGPEDRVFILAWNNDFIMNHIQRKSVSRYIHMVPLITSGYASDQHWADLVSELELHPPKVMLVQEFDYSNPADLSGLVTWALKWFDTYFVPPETLDSTNYPNRAMFVSFIASNYQEEYCMADLCLLKLSQSGSAGRY